MTTTQPAGAQSRNKTRMEWIAEQMAENGMVTQAREVIAMETALQSAHAGLAEAQMENEQQRHDIDRLYASLQTEVMAAEKTEAALRRSMVALDDWLNTYAEEFCDEQRVKEARERIKEFGTIGYIAEVQQQNHAALSSTGEGSGG